MAINERKRQQKLARKQSRRKQRVAVDKKLYSEIPAPIIVEGEMPEKMSAVLLEFVEPLLQGDYTRAMFDKTIAFAILAWNTGLLPLDKQKQAISDLMEKFAFDDDDNKAEFLAMFTMLLARKQQEFADINRYIIDYCITDTGDDFHLSVISSVTPL